MENQIHEMNAMAAEQAADLRALEAMAANGDAAQLPPGEAAPEAPPRPALAEEIAGLLVMMAGMVKPALPTVAEIYSKETCETVGHHVAAVCDKHGWLQEGVGGKWGEEIMCLAVVGPIAWATVEAAKSDIAARKAKTADTARQIGVPVPEGQLGSKNLAVGTPVPAEA